MGIYLDGLHYGVDVCMHTCIMYQMDDAQMNEYGWMGKGMDEWIDWCTDEWIDGYTDGCMDSKMDI